MNNLLREIETEDAIIYKHQVYSVKMVKKCKSLFDGFLADGKIVGSFGDDTWVGYSGVKKFGIDFSIDKKNYDRHAGKELGIGFKTMETMLRCYAVYCLGAYIFQTISSEKVGSVKSFLQEYGDKDFKLNKYGTETVKEFLMFIGTPEIQLREIMGRIPIIREKKSGQRKLSPIMNYLVIENEVNRIFRSNPPKDIFRRWFPIFFWVNITFILPLRATEMLVTPKDCIQRNPDGSTFLKVRRTKLKKGSKTVYYDVDRDYAEFTYEIPDTWVVRVIERYMILTGSQDRRFLFEYSPLMVNEMLSLHAFNKLIASFVNENIIGNSAYEFARHAAVIEKFECVTAGDSRPIAMANLYFQNTGEDICRQLADHVHINTSSGYYTNITETIWASSVIRMQKTMDYERRHQGDMYRKGTLLTAEGMRCVSERRAIDESDLRDCVDEGHLEDCMGCRFYRPSEKELDDFLKEQKKKADEAARKVIDFMNGVLAMKNSSKTLEELFLSAQTDAVRFRMGCDIKAKEMYEKWQEHKNTQKTSF